MEDIRSFDCIFRKGTIVSNGKIFSEPQDIGVKEGVIQAVEKDLSGKAIQEFDVKDKYVTPGLIDFHTHAYYGCTQVSIDIEPICHCTGVTTIVDAGSAGAANFDGLRLYVEKAIRLNLFAFLNISVIGLTSMCNMYHYVGELFDLKFADTELAIKTVEKNRDIIKAIKVRCSTESSGGNGISALHMARNVGAITGLPMVVHVGYPPPTLEEVLPLLRQGDVLTHCFSSHRTSIITPSGKIKNVVADARERGVLFDIGHGKASFSFDTARKALDQGFLPDFISTDLHSANVNGPVFDLCTTMDKFLYLKMPFETVIEKTTHNPATFLREDRILGSLEPGKEASISVFTFEEKPSVLCDSAGDERSTPKRMRNEITMFKGSIVFQRCKTQ